MINFKGLVRSIITSLFIHVTLRAGLRRRYSQPPSLGGRSRHHRPPANVGTPGKPDQGEGEGDTPVAPHLP